MLFSGDYSPLQQFVLQDADISQHTRDALHKLLEDYKGNRSSDATDVGYTKCIEMNIVMFPQLPSIASLPYTLLLNTLSGFKMILNIENKS